MTKRSPVPFSEVAVMFDVLFVIDGREDRSDDEMAVLLVEWAAVLAKAGWSQARWNRALKSDIEEGSVSTEEFDRIVAKYQDCMQEEVAK
jgi:hypothetical protein